MASGASEWLDWITHMAYVTVGSLICAVPLVDPAAAVGQLTPDKAVRTTDLLVFKTTIPTLAEVGNFGRVSKKTISIVQADSDTFCSDKGWLTVSIMFALRTIIISYTSARALDCISRHIWSGR